MDKLSDAEYMFRCLTETLDRIRSLNAWHDRKGFRSCEATPALAACHLMEEAVEVCSDINSGNDPTEELADVLAVLLHMIRICDIEDYDVFRRANEKLSEVFNVPATARI